MSLTVIAGQIVVGSSDTYQPWDATRTTNPGAASADNRGCAPGWAAIYVQDSLTGDTVRVCRRLDQSVLGPTAPQTIAEESSPDWYDQSAINIAGAAEAVVQGGGQVLGSAGSVLGNALAILGPYLAIGAVAYLLIMNLPAAFTRGR
jgi:hypothetical protein